MVIKSKIHLANVKASFKRTGTKNDFWQNIHQMSVLYGHSCKLYETIIENWRLQSLSSCDFVQNDKILGINNSQKWNK